MDGSGFDREHAKHTKKTEDVVRNFLNAAGGHDYAPVCELLVQSNPSLLVEV